MCEKLETSLRKKNFFRGKKYFSRILTSIMDGKIKLRSNEENIGSRLRDRTPTKSI